MKESDLSLPQLRAFVAVVDAGSLAAAGRGLGASTASISKTLARLEETLRVKVLHRSTHSVSLTKDGEALIDLARRIVRDSDELQRAATLERSTGWIRIAAPVALMRDVVAPLVTQFGRENPTVRLDLRASSDAVDLAKEGIDLAIRNDTLARAPGHVRTQWFAFPWVLCATPAYLKGRKRPQHPDDLADHAQVTFRNPRTGQIRPWTFRDNVQLTPTGSAVYDDGGSGWRAVLDSAGIGSIPLYLCADALRHGEVTEVLRDWRDKPATLVILRQDGRLTPPRVKSMIAYLRKHAPRFTDLM
jgi:DNA-binding transcriptional LysR family regulator